MAGLNVYEPVGIAGLTKFPLVLIFSSVNFIESSHIFY
jgi:hypothetical protein